MSRFGMVVLLSLGMMSCGDSVEMRFENTSDQTFDSVEVLFGESAQFDELAPGAITDYRTFEGAYHYGYVRVVAEGREYVIQPTDFVGEKQLSSGRYTHSLSLDPTATPPFGLNGSTREDD